MATITTRSGKGSPLTNNEVDANFNNLNTDKAELSGAAFTGAITTNSTIDGRDVATDGTKLDGIESGATADQTAAQIKTAYESNSDTNAFTDADHSKLDGIEASADVTDTTNVTAAGALMDSELTSIASVKALNQGVATTDSPDFAALNVNGTATMDGLVVDAASDVAFGTKFFWDASAESLGIGTSSPAAKLDLGTSTGQKLLMYANNNIKYGMSIETSEYRMFAEDQATLTFGHLARTDGTTYTERMRIDSSGNVLLGTSTTPSSSDVKQVISSSTGAFTQYSYNGGAGSVIGAPAVSQMAMYTTTGNIGSETYTERMRIDSSGNVLVGVTSPQDFDSTTTNGHTFYGGSTNVALHSRNNANPLALQRTGNDGSICNFYRDNTTVGSIGTEGGRLQIGKGASGLYFYDSGPSVLPWNIGSNSTADNSIDLGSSGGRFKDLYLSGAINITGGKISYYAADANAPYFADAGNVGIRFSQAGVDDVVPCSTTGADRDNGINFGSAGARWGTLFAATGTINTSDKNEKQDIAELSDAEQRVAVAAKGLLRKFRWKDSVAEKGDDARIHFGVMAQDLQAAFATEGLDASDYAMWCSDTWVDKETNEEKTRLGIRYSELLAFIISAI